MYSSLIPRPLTLIMHVWLSAAFSCGPQSRAVPFQVQTILQVIARVLPLLAFPRLGFRLF
jgi:hypothetical protein